jgi:hypothetical protein
MKPPMDPRMRACLLCTAGAGGVFSVAALAFFGLRTGLSVATGGALATGNLWALARIMGALLPSGRPEAMAQSRAAWSLVAALKMLALFVVVWLLMSEGLVAPLQLVVGFGALPIGIAIGSLVGDKAPASSEDPPPAG